MLTWIADEQFLEASRDQKKCGESLGPLFEVLGLSFRTDCSERATAQIEEHVLCTIDAILNLGYGVNQTKEMVFSAFIDAGDGVTSESKR